MVFWAILGGIAKAGATVGKVGATAGKIGLAGAKAAGMGAAKFGSGMIKGMRGKPIGKTLGAPGKVGHAIGKTGKSMKAMGGGGGDGGGAQAKAKKAQYTPGTQVTLAPPTGYTRRPIALRDPTEVTEERERRNRLIDNPKEVISGKTAMGLLTGDQLQLEQGSVTDMLRKTAEREYEKGNREPPPKEGFDLTAPGVEQAIGGERGLTTPTGFEQTGVPESRDVREPFWSKAVSGVGKTIFAGAPGALQEVVGGALPSTRYEKKRAKIERQRDLIWQIADTLDSPEDIKSFVKNQNNVEAITSRLPGVNDKEDVEEYLSLSLEGMKPSTLLQHGWQAGLEAPEGGAIEINVDGQKIYLSPEDPVWKVIGQEKPVEVEGPNDPRMLLNLPISKIDKVDLEILIGDKILKEGETLTGPTGEIKAGAIKERKDFTTQYMKDNPKASPTDALFSFASLNKGKGRFTPTATSGGVVLIDRYTGKQDKIVIDKKITDKWGFQMIQEVDDITGRPVDVGVMPYLKESIGEEGPSVFLPIYFNEMGHEEDVVIDAMDDIEEGNIPENEGWRSLLPSSWLKAMNLEPTQRVLDREKAEKKTKGKGKKKKSTKTEKMALTPPKGAVKTERVLEYLGGYGEL